MRVSVVIADDEKLSREKLAELLQDVSWVECVGEAADGPTTVEVVNRLEPDLLFLDIRMPGLTGLEVLERLEHTPRIVFTTAYDEYAVTAFELHALDYLLKPFGRQRFLETLARVEDTFARAEHSVEAGRQALARPKPVERLFVRSRGGIVPVRMGEVSRFEAQDDYVAIHVSGERHLASVRMRELEDLLDPDRFLRIHRSHIVNLDYVKSIRPHHTNRLEITLRDGTRLFASRARSRELRDRAV